jgi:predicted O-linked N-acetylglucosamine transferase (SPINDLY family)
MNQAAIDFLERAHKLERPDVESLIDLGKAYLAVDRAQDAKRTLRRALALDAGRPDGHAGLGAALIRLGEPREGDRSLRRAYSLTPDSSRAWFNLGNLLRDLGRLEEAERGYARALALEPGDVDALNNRAIVLAETGRSEAAVECLRAALAIAPEHRQAHHNLGNVLKSLGRLGEAEEAYRKVLALDPEAAATRVNLASVLKDLGRLDEAEDEFRRTLAAHPDTPEVHYALGNTLYLAGHPDAARESYMRALALDPDFAAARWESAINQLYPVYESEEESKRCRVAFASSLGDLGRWLESHRVDPSENVVGLPPFSLAYQEVDNRQLLAAYGSACASLMRSWLDGGTFSPMRPMRGQRIRVAIVSAHVRDHSVWNALIKGWLVHLDPARFELRVFHLGASEDDETRDARSRVSRFEAGKRGLTEWTELILRDRPDVLVYPEIGMDALTAKLASLRLAPVQVATWGHPETTGLPTIDYYLSAQALEGPEAETFYTERLVKLPGVGCYCSPLAPADRSDDAVRLPSDMQRPILVCPGTPFKYAPQYDHALVQIARELGRCTFVFFVHRLRAYSEKLRIRLALAFERAGLDFGRFATFVPWQPRPAFYSLLRDADVYLDTIGFSGFNTALQAVECGLPIVTRDGRFLRSRLASGILEHMGMRDLVASTVDEYVRRVTALARDDAYRDDVRRRMEASRGLLFENPAPVRALEAFLMETVD